MYIHFQWPKADEYTYGLFHSACMVLCVYGARLRLIWTSLLKLNTLERVTELDLDELTIILLAPNF